MTGFRLARRDGVVQPRPARVATQVTFGDARQAVLAAADAESADLLFVGARGAGAVPRLALGSTSLYAVRHHTGDVVVCKDMLPAGPRTWLVGFDGSASSRRALARAVSLARADDAVVLCAVFVPRTITLGARVRTACDPNLGEYMAEANAAARATLAAAAGALLAADPAYARVRLVVRDSAGAPVAAALAAVAAETRAAVLAIGSHGAGVLERLLLGSTAEALLETPVAAILVARAK
jgi:nucleotide-binding universal stress UspA family protein